MWGTLIAIFTLATGVKGLQLVTGVQRLAGMFDGVALVVAVGFAVWGERRHAAKRALSVKPPDAPPVEPPAPTTDLVDPIAEDVSLGAPPRA